MEVKKIGNFSAPEVVNGGGKIPSDKTSGVGFESFLKQNLQQPAVDSAGAGLIDKNVQAGLASKGAIKFSQHAIDRMQSRGIRLSPTDLERLQTAVEKAAAKGSRDSLVLLDSSAMIVSVKNNTVVTVMDRAALKENVFTNIDSTIVM